MPPPRLPGPPDSPIRYAIILAGERIGGQDAATLDRASHDSVTLRDLDSARGHLERTASTSAPNANGPRIGVATTAGRDAPEVNVQPAAPPFPRSSRRPARRDRDRGARGSWGQPGSWSPECRRR